MNPRIPRRARAAARNVTIGLIANFLTGAGNLGRPLVDHTGLNGTFDFSVEWTPDPPPGVDFNPDQSATFLEALNEQRGLKLESSKGRVEVIVVDHVERPSEN
jgi:bla regulator protein blaR1